MIPSHLIECPIEEATCVVNARGEEFRAYYYTQFGECLLRVHLHPAISSAHNSMNQVGLHNACLTPCKTKPVFVEAVSPWIVTRVFAPSSYPDLHLVQMENEHGHVVNAGYFKTSDIAGIESIPTDQLEIVLRVKKVSPA